MHVLASRVDPKRNRISVHLTAALLAVVVVLTGSRAYAQVVLEIATEQSVGVTPADLVLADLDTDGHLDAITGGTGANYVSVSLGNGDGTLQAPTQYAVGDGVRHLVVADFDEDGSLDIVSRNTSLDLSFLKGLGDGTFLPEVRSSVVVGSNLLTADIDEDGHADLILSEWRDTRGRVLYGDGTGAFPSNVATDFGVAASVMKLADFNGDQHLDAAMIDGDSNTLVRISLGDGNGTFTPTTDLAVFKASQLATADFDRDGVTDLAIGTFNPSTVQIYLGDGSGAFALETTVDLVFGGPTAIATPDLDDDGNTDLAVAVTRGDGMVVFNEIDMLLGDGTGGFVFDRVSYRIGGNLPRLIAGNFDEDGYTDLAAAESWSGDELYVIRNASFPSFEGAAPCGTTLTTFEGSPIQFDVEALASTGLAGEFVTIDTDSTGLPAGAVTIPPLPTPPGQPATTTFQWTPAIADIGTHEVTFVATDQLGRESLCSVTVRVVPTAWIVLAEARGSDPFSFGIDGHEFATQVERIRRAYPIAIGTAPRIRLPREDWRGFAPFGDTDTKPDGGVPQFSREFRAQILLWNPVEYPQNPERFSQPFDVVIAPDGSVTGTAYGTSDGITATFEQGVFPTGRRWVRFPFTVDP